MAQLYFLSIFCNGLIGYILFAGEKEGDTDIKGSLPVLSFLNPTSHLVIGIVCAVTGFLKLFVTMNNVPIFGDLVAALGGIIASFILIFGVYRRDLLDSMVNRESKLDQMGERLLGLRKPMGMALMVIALLHFLFPRALFL